ncbi:hypothetical protein D3C84_704030 [compost metagenome]
MVCIGGDSCRTNGLLDPALVVVTVLNKIAPQLDQLSQLIPIQVRLDLRKILEFTSKFRQHLSVDLVGLGNLAHGTCVVARAFGVDPNYIQPLPAQGPEHGPFIAARGLKQNPLDLKLAQARNQLREALRVILDLKMRDFLRKKPHIQSRLRNIETNEVGNHRHALLH